MKLVTLAAAVAGCLACAASAPAGEFLLNQRDASTIWRWDPVTGDTALYHTTQANDADVNFAEGSSFGWIAEHFNDNFARFVPGSSNGLDSRYDLGQGGRTHYAYPKHITVFDSNVVVMSRNDATIWRYDENGNQIAGTATGNGTGQGMATDGLDFYASFWNGSNSFFERYNAAFILQETIALPLGMGDFNNLFDFAYDDDTGHFFALATSGEVGTGTQSSTVLEFGMGGSVVDSYDLPFLADGIGQYGIPGPATLTLLAVASLAARRRRRC